MSFVVGFSRSVSLLDTTVGLRQQICIDRALVIGEITSPRLIGPHPHFDRIASLECARLNAVPDAEPFTNGMPMVPVEEHGHVTTIPGDQRIAATLCLNTLLKQRHFVRAQWRNPSADDWIDGDRRCYRTRHRKHPSFGFVVHTVRRQQSHVTSTAASWRSS
jgi:hypothetical protein